MEGIWVNDAGNVAETCMGNVAIVDQEGVLRSPHYDGSILAGTTLLRVFALAPQLIQVETGRVAKPVIFSAWVSQWSMCSRILQKICRLYRCAPVSPPCVPHFLFPHPVCAAFLSFQSTASLTLNSLGLGNFFMIRA